MAVTADPVGSEMVIRVENGTTTSGATKYANRSFNNVKATATNDDVYAVAASLASLQTKTITAYQRLNSLELINA